MTRVDTDSAGTPDLTNQVYPDALSADGRYLLLSARSDTVLVPEEYRTTEPDGFNALRKEIATGALELVGVDETGAPTANIDTTISRDGDATGTAPPLATCTTW